MDDLRVGGGVGALFLVALLGCSAEDSGACTKSCTPGSVRCDGSGLQRCEAAPRGCGTVWSSTQWCEEGTYCSAQAGACAPLTASDYPCPPGTARASNGRCEGAGASSLNIDLRTSLIRGVVRVNGKAPEGGSCDSIAEITLKGETTGQVVRLTSDCTSGYTFRARVMRDRYRAEVTLTAAGASGVSLGRWIEADWIDASLPEADAILDGHRVALRGRILRDGNPLRLSEEACASPGKMVLAGTPADLGCTSDGQVTFSGEFFEGDWYAEVQMASLPAARRLDPPAPAMESAFPSDGLQIDGTTPFLEVNVRVAQVRGDVRLGGVLPSCVGFLDTLGEWVFTHRPSGAQFISSITCGSDQGLYAQPGSYLAALPQGTYDVQIRPSSHRPYGVQNLPGPFAVREELTVSADRRWDVNLPLPGYRLHLKRDGQEVAPGCGVLFFEREGFQIGVVDVPCEASAVDVPAGQLVAGTYRLLFVPEVGGGERAYPVSLPESGMDATVDLRSSKFTDGRLLWNGRPPREPDVCRVWDDAGRVSLDEDPWSSRIRCGEHGTLPRMLVSLGLHQGAWSPPGAWLVAWGRDVAPPVLPLQPFDWRGEADPVMEVLTRWVEGVVRVDDLPLTGSGATCQDALATVVLERPGYRRTFEVPCGGEARFSGLVPVGAYDVRVTSASPGLVLPADSGVVVKGWSVQ